MAINTLMIDGHAARDAQTRSIGKQELASFSVAHERRWKDGDDWKSETFFIDVNAWAGVAKRGGAVKKGDRVLVIGRLNIRKYKDKDGADRIATEIIANEVSILSAKADRTPRDGGRYADNGRDEARQTDLDDEIPF